MTITPLSPQAGTLTTFEPPPISDHLAGMDEATYIAHALEWRKRTLEGKETHNDRALVEAWLAQCSNTGSVETVKTYSRHIERFRLFIRQWNEQPIHEQTDERLLAPGDPEAIEAFAASLRSRVDAGELSISTYNVIVAAISSFYKWCSQPTRRAFSNVPLSPVPSGLQLKKRARKAKALSHEQLHSVLHGARNCKTSTNARRDELIIRLLYCLGTRATETACLKWSDVVQLESGPAVHVRAENAKGKKERFVPIDTTVVELLDALKASQPESEWLIPNLRQPWRHISRQGLWKLCNRAGNAAGVKFWTHCARHTNATHSYAETHDPKLIQATLGHADIGTTMDLYVDQTDGESTAKVLSKNVKLMEAN